MLRISLAIFGLKKLKNNSSNLNTEHENVKNAD